MRKGPQKGVGPEDVLADMSIFKRVIWIKIVIEFEIECILGLINNFIQSLPNF